MLVSTDLTPTESNRCAPPFTRRTDPPAKSCRSARSTPEPGPGEVRVKLKSSGVNPSDVKDRAGITRKIAFPRMIPHSDGAGEIDAVGEGVAKSRVGERVWTWNGAMEAAVRHRAEYIVLPETGGPAARPRRPRGRRLLRHPGHDRIACGRHRGRAGRT